MRSRDEDEAARRRQRTRFRVGNERSGQPAPVKIDGIATSESKNAASRCCCCRADATGASPSMSIMNGVKFSSNANCAATRQRVRRRPATARANLMRKEIAMHLRPCGERCTMKCCCCWSYNENRQAHRPAFWPFEETNNKYTHTPTAT